MKLRKLDFVLDWPVSIKIINLRKFIMDNLMKKGIVIRWSIVDIKASIGSPNIKNIRINVILVDPINS